MGKKLRLFLGEYITAMVAYWICTGFIIAKLTEYFELPLGVSNILTSLSSMFLVLQPLGGVLYSKIRQKRGYLISVNLLWRVCLCFVFFSVFLSQRTGMAVFCVCLLCMQLFQQIISPAYEDWHVQAAETAHYGKFYAVREVVFMILYTVMAAVVQIAISLSEHWGQLQQGFIITGILESLLLIISIILMFRLSAPSSYANQSSGSLRMFIQVLKNRSHTAVIIANSAWSIANVFIGGLFGVYAVRVLNIDFIQLMIWGMVGNLLRTLFGPIFAKVAARIGWKQCVSNIFIIYAFLAVLLYFTTPENAFLTAPIYLSLSSLPVSGLNVGILKMRIASSTQELRSVYFSAYSLFSGGASMIGTFCSSFLISLIEAGSISLSLHSLFLLGLVLLIIPFILFRKIPVEIPEDSN